MSDVEIWRKPRHHLDVNNSSDHVHWVELFFDLVHVVTIFLLGNFLSQHLDWQGFLIFTGIFVAFFYAWADSSIYNSLYISTDGLHRLIMAAQSVTVMFFAAALSTISGQGWVFFALAFSANRALTALLYWRARQGESGRDGLAYRQGRNFFVLAGVFALAAFLPRPLAYWVFAAGIIGIQLQYTLPRFGTLNMKRFSPRLGHISERFALIMLILLGEGFFKMVVTLSDKGVAAASFGALSNMALGGLSLFAMAWIYFDAIGDARPRSRARGTLLGYWLGHMLLMWATVMVGVALAGEIHVGFLEPYPYAYGLLGVAGLSGFLASVWILQHMVEGSEATMRDTKGGLRLFGIGIVAILALVLPIVPAVIGNTLFWLALLSQIALPPFTAVISRQ